LCVNLSGRVAADLPNFRSRVNRKAGAFFLSRKSRGVLEAAALQ
jgi:hypothetical protein